MQKGGDRTHLAEEEENGEKKNNTAGTTEKSKATKRTVGCTPGQRGEV